MKLYALLFLTILFVGWYCKKHKLSLLDYLLMRTPREEGDRT